MTMLPSLWQRRPDGRMPSLPILSVTIHYEHDTVAARQRARQIARLLGFDSQDQTRISTAVSEIARNAFNYAGGGRVEYLLEGRTAPQLFIVKITDSGPGIRDLDAILEGRYQSQTGMGLGIIGARRLMDQFQDRSVAGQGHDGLAEEIASEAGSADHGRRSGADRRRPGAGNAAGRVSGTAAPESGTVDRARRDPDPADRVDAAEPGTGGYQSRRGGALYAELDEKADHLRRADELKSRFLSNMSHEFRSPLNSILALERAVARSRGWGLDLGAGSAGGLHQAGGAGSAGTGERFTGSGEGGGRQGGSEADRI